MYVLPVVCPSVLWICASVLVMKRMTVPCCECSAHFSAEEPHKACSRVGEHMLAEHSIVSVLMLTERNGQMKDGLQAGKVKIV